MIMIDTKIVKTICVIHAFIDSVILKHLPFTNKCNRLLEAEINVNMLSDSRLAEFLRTLRFTPTKQGRSQTLNLK